MSDIEVRVFRVSYDDINWRHRMSCRPIFNNMGLIKATLTQWNDIILPTGECLRHDPVNKTWYASFIVAKLEKDVR